MTTLDSVPITACHECIATLTLPLALFLLLAETTVGGVVTVAFLRLTGGLTHGFLKFITVTYAILAALAFLVVVAAPPGSYHRLLAVNQFAAGTLPYLQGLLVITMVIQVVMTWRRQDAALRGWLPTLLASVLLLAGIMATLGPLAGSAPVAAAIGLTVALSSMVLGAATTGMLLGHWYLVTPALTNAPLLRAIEVLLISLVLQAIVFPLTLGGLNNGSGYVAGALGISLALSVLWTLGAVVLPLAAAGLALPTCRMRSFMSTTGLLYLAMIAILPGQLLGQLLLFVVASA